MDRSAIDGLLQGAVDQQVVPGVIAAVGDRDGALYEGAFGALSVDGDEATVADTTIWIASMTKALASVAALQLIEKGELELEQPVADVIPSFGELQVLDGFDGDEPRLRAPASQATIRNLFTHTSGLGYWFLNADLFRYLEMTGAPNPFSGQRAAFDVPLIADPGMRWEYGVSVDWLGLVVEAVSGKDLATYLEEHVFAPLGMVDTTFAPSDAQRERMMTIHARTPEGGLTPSDIEPPAEPECWSGGAGAASTAPDYLRFMRALLCGGELDGERILRPESVDEMFTDHLCGAALPEISRSAIPELSLDVPSLPVAQGFGLGLHLVLEDLPGMRRAGTGDWAGLANCYYWIDRASGIAGTFLTAVLPFFDERVLGTALGFEQAVYAEVGAPATA